MERYFPALLVWRLTLATYYMWGIHQYLATSTVQFEVVCEDAFEALYIVKLYSPPSIASWTKPCIVLWYIVHMYVCIGQCFYQDAMKVS